MAVGREEAAQGRADRATLVVAHPGHELRVHHWLEVARPTVFVLTDGSGAVGRSRLASTTALLAKCGASPGRIYGRFTDRALYAAIIRGDAALFAALAVELAEALCIEETTYVAGDASEGYHPGHDLCHVLVQAAVALAGRAGQRTRAFDFPLVGSPDAGEIASETVSLALDDAALGRKIAASRAYAELEGEVDRALDAHGIEAFRVERLRPVGGEIERASPPYYERYGEQQVARGRYAEVLRYREHVAPLVLATRRRLGL